MHVIHNYSTDATIIILLIGADTAPVARPYTEQRGPHVPPTCRTPEQCFALFFDDSLWQFLVEQTNAYAQRKIASMTVSAHSLYRNWKPVSVEEMKGFIAVILNMGIIQLNNLKDYWATDCTTNLPFIRSVFSRDRFFQIFGALHVGELDGTTKRSKIQPLLDQLRPAIESAYTPGQEIALDESVISFRGRVSFRQYLKGKPNPWGIKAFALADSKSGYMYKICIYYGKETQLIDQPDLPHTCRVVMTLADGMHNKGHDLYVDRFYNSPLLAVELAKAGITVTGTVQANRKGLPATFQSKKKEPRGTLTGYRADDMLAFYWVDKRKVFMITTKHELSMVDVPPRYAQLHTHTILSLVPRLHSTVMYVHFLTLVCETSSKVEATARKAARSIYAQVYITIQ